MNSDRRRWASAVAVVAAVFLAGCSQGEDLVSSGTSRGEGEVTTARPESAVADRADPRDLVSLTNYGSSQTMVTFDSYDQMRDYSDVTALVTVDSYRITREYTEPFLVNGEIQFSLRVDAVLGGRFTNVKSGQVLQVMMPQAATSEVLQDLTPRLDRIISDGTQYVFFLRAEKTADGMASYHLKPMNIDGPTGILAVWPGDGRLTTLVPHRYIYAPAERRGEELTGTSSPGEPEWQPSFEGPPPVGLTVERVLDDFAGVAGQPKVAPPAGWGNVEPLLVPPPA